MGQKDVDKRRKVVGYWVDVIKTTIIEIALLAVLYLILLIGHSF